MNLKIKKIRIDGYKNLQDTTIEFSGINALVALNNYGKSNLLEAIKFANNFIQASENVKKTLMFSPNRVPINNSTADKNFTFEIELDGEFEQKQAEINYQFSFEWIKNDNKGLRVVGELLKIKTEGGSKATTFIDRKNVDKFYKSSEQGRCNKAIVISDESLIINKLLNYDELYYHYIVEKLNNLNFTFVSIKDIDKLFSTRTIIGPSKEEGMFSVEQAASISELFFNLEKEKKEKYSLLKNSILDLLPDIEYIKPIEIDLKSESNNHNVPFNLSEKIYDIRVKIKSNNQELSIRHLSEGSKRIFHVLRVCLMSEQLGTQLLMFEELENSIHPALLQRLLMIIKELTPETQVLLTSHSTHLVKYLDLDCIYIGIPNKEGTAYFKKVKKSKQNKLLNYAKDSEMNLGDFIFDMLVDGFDDDSFWLQFI